MKPLKHIKKIIWAVDPFEENPKQVHNTAAIVGTFAKNFQAKVEIVYANAFPQLYLASKAQKLMETPFFQTAQKSLDAIAQNLKNISCSTKILIHHAHGKKSQSASALLIGYAKKTKTDLIVAASHGRSGIIKLFLGSFAESLMMHSDVPVLIVSPHQKRFEPHHLKDVLLPTDLSPESRRVFENIVKFAAVHKLHLTLLHAMINEFIPAMTADAFIMGNYAMIDSTIFQDSLKRQHEKLDEWVAFATAKGVSCKKIIPRKGGTISDIITHASERGKYDFAIMSTHQGASSHELLGSVTRKVVRKAKIPIITVKD